MKTAVDPREFAKVIAALVGGDCRSVVKYITPKLVVRATWRHKPKANHTREEMVVTYGAPNYLEARFAKLAVRAKEPFPIKKIQLRAWPKKRVPSKT